MKNNRLSVFVPKKERLFLRSVQIRFHHDYIVVVSGHNAHHIPFDLLTIKRRPIHVNRFVQSLEMLPSRRIPTLHEVAKSSRIKTNQELQVRIGIVDIILVAWILRKHLVTHLLGRG